MNRTPLYQYYSEHAHLVEFAGYEMPVWYTSVVDEHLAVRNGAGIFDVSHMGRVTVYGEDADSYVDSLIPTDARGKPAGKSFYTLFLNERGGIIDDLIIAKREHDYLFVVNASNRKKDLQHMESLAIGFDVSVRDMTDETAMIAIQGPTAARALQPLTSYPLDSVKRFTHVTSQVGGLNALITRTGYTGEDGFEIILDESGDSGRTALEVWSALSSVAKPCGLGARDSLRTEAGLPLYGSDIDEQTNPLEADLGWVISKGKTSYVGSDAVAMYLAEPLARLRRGIVLEDRIPRHGFEIEDEGGGKLGSITSGTYSPILKKGIGMGYVAMGSSAVGMSLMVRVRDQVAVGKVVKMPFYNEALYGWKRGGKSK